ncbi:hypothetical protein C8J57DRAFT_1252612 [Mycena rebaudengoi]|nr:hypothetical protein C8J57DRAFT_1252612 [Mycena rebaudengoi]
MPYNAPISQLQSSLLLGSLSLIPDNTIRYTILGGATVITIITIFHFKHPSSKLSQLEEAMKEVHDMIHRARMKCPRDHLNLTEEKVRLLQIQRAASIVQSRLLRMGNFSFNFRMRRSISQSIIECEEDLKRIRTAVQLILEAERQRRYTEDINETRNVLTTVRSTSSVSLQEANAAYMHEDTYCRFETENVALISSLTDKQRVISPSFVPCY